MQLNNTSVPRIKTLIESHSTQFLHTHTNKWNPKRLIGLFQIALKYREFISCPLPFFYKLQFVPATTEIKLNICSLAAKVFFQQECDDALDHLFKELPFPLIAKHLQNLTCFFKNSDRPVTIEELKECIMLLDQIHPSKRRALAASLSELQTSRRMAFHRELIKPENAAHLDMMASLGKEQISSGYKSCFNGISTPEAFAILAQVNTLYKDHKPVDVNVTIHAFCQLSRSQRNIIVQLSPEFADFPFGIDRFIDAFKHTSFEKAREEIASIAPLIHAKTSQNEMGSLFDVIAKIPPHMRHNTVKLVKNCGATLNTPALLECLWGLKKHEVHNLLKWANCFDLGKNGILWKSFIISLRLIPKKERKTLISLYQHYSLACCKKEEALTTSDTKSPIYSISAFNSVCRMNPVHRENILKAHHFIFSVTEHNAFTKGNFNLTLSYYRFSQSETDAENLFKRLYKITSDSEKLESLLNSLLLLTNERRIEAIKAMETTQCGDLALKYSSSEITEILEVSRILFPNQELNSSDCEMILKIPGNRIDFVNLLKPIIKGGDKTDVAAILGAALICTHEDLSKIVSFPFPFTEDGKERSLIFKLLIRCFFSNNMDVYTQCLPLKTVRMENEQWRVFVIILLERPQEDRQEFLTLCKTLLSVPQAQINSILHGIYKLSLANLKQKLSQIEILKKNHFASYSTAHLFVKLNSVSTYQFERWQKNVNLIIERFPELEQRDELLPLFSSFPTEKLKSACDLIPLFVKKVTSVSHLQRLIDVVGSAPREEIKDRLESLKPLFTGLSPLDQLTLYLMFSRTSIADIPDAIKDLQHLTKKKEGRLIAYSRSYLRWGDTKAHRAAVLNYFEVLSQDTKVPSPENLAQMSGFSESNWTRLYPVCLPLFNHFHFQMSVKIDLINMFASYPTQHTEELVAYSLILNLKEDIVFTLWKIANVPKHMRPQLIDDLRLIMPRMEKLSVDIVLDFLRTISPSERKSLISEALQYFKYATDHELLNTVSLLEHIPPTIRHQLLEFIEPYNGEITTLKKHTIMGSLSKNLPSEQWEEGLAVIRLLPEKMDPQIALPLLMKENSEDRNYLLTTLDQYCNSVDDNENIVFFRELCAIPPENRPLLMYYASRVLENQLEVDLSKRTAALRCLRGVTVDLLNEILSSHAWKYPLSRLPDNCQCLANLTHYSDSERNIIAEKMASVLEQFDPKTNSVNWFLTNLLSIESHDRLKFIQFVFSTIPNPSNKLFQFLKLLFYAKQSDSPLWKVISAIQKDFSANFNVETFLELKLAKQDQLESTYRLVCEFRHLDLPHLGKLLVALTHVPAEKRELLLSYALKMTCSYSFDGLIDIIETLTPCCEEEISSLLHNIQLIRMHWETSLTRPEVLVSDLLKIPRQERSEVIAVLLELTWIIEGSTEPFSLSPVILKIVQDKDVDYLKEVFPIIKKIRQGSYVISCVIPVLVSFAKENRHDLLKLAEESIETLEDYKDLIETIHQHRHEDLLPLCEPLFRATDKGIARAHVLSIASSHPRSETQHIISLIAPLLPGAGWTDHIGVVFKYLHSIPNNERSDALKLALHLSNDFGNRFLHHCLYSVVSCKTEERKEIVEFALSRFPYCSLGLLFEFINVLRSYESSERIVFLDPFLKSISEQFDNPETILQLIKLLSYYSPSERQEVLAFCSPLFTMTLSDEGCTLRHLLLIPPQDRCRAVEMIRLNPNQSLQNPLEYLFRFSNGLKNRSLLYINQLLSLGQENKDFIYLVTLRVINLMENHLIDQEHIVAQKALELHAILIDSSDKSNPYHVYQTLKQLLKTEKPLSPLLQPVEIEGASVIPHVAKWRQDAQAKPFTLADLPKNLPADNFQSLFNAFFQRIRQLNAHKMSQVNKYITDKYEHAPHLLVDLFYKPYIQNLFSIDGPDEKIVDMTVYGIHAILKYVCELDHTINDETILTEREDMLFKMCWSIRECEQGQSDGIRTFFNQLPPQYKLSSIIAKPSAEQRVADVVFESIQGVLTACFQDSKLFRLLDAGVNSSQAPHKTLYLMNRLFQHVGLRHQIKFDRHTQLIPSRFFDIPLAEYLDKFFKICTPMLLVQRLQRDIEECLEKKIIKYRDLAYTIEHIVQRKRVYCIK